MKFVIRTSSLAFNNAESILNKYPKLNEFDFIHNIDNRLFFILDNPNSLKIIIDEFAKDNIEIILSSDGTGEIVKKGEYYFEIYDDYR